MSMAKDRLKVKKFKSNLNRERGLIMATGAERALPLIPVGETAEFSEMEFRSSVIRTAINRLEKLGYKFDCTTKGCIGYCMVTRTE